MSEIDKTIEKIDQLELEITELFTWLKEVPDVKTDSPLYQSKLEVYRSKKEQQRDLELSLDALRKGEKG